MESLIEVRRDFRNHKKGSLILCESVLTNVYDFKIKELHRFFLPNSNKHIAYFKIDSGNAPELVLSKKCTNNDLICWLVELSNANSIKYGGF